MDNKTFETKASAICLFLFFEIRSCDNRSVSISFKVQPLWLLNKSSTGCLKPTLLENHSREKINKLAKLQA
jgi:hypothetical protein